MELLIVVVVIAILAAISIVAYNGIVGKAKDVAKLSEISQWKKKAEIYKTQNGIHCPDGYAFVYGKHVLGTTDFCVMKYEAKNIGGEARSEAAGAPWTAISQSGAIALAAAAGGHLITESEWMAIAADVLSIKYNWSSGKPGTGYIFQGHVDGNPAQAIAASDDDNDGLAGFTGGTGAVVGSNSQRVLILSSGDAIWDFSGNVAEWTQQAVGSPVHNVSSIGVSGVTHFQWHQWNTGSPLSVGNLPSKSRPISLVGVDPALFAPVPSWSSSRGIGRIYANYGDSSSRAFQRGGDWNSYISGGVLSLSLDRGAAETSEFVGFRVAR